MNCSAEYCVGGDDAHYAVANYVEIFGQIIKMAMGMRFGYNSTRRVWACGRGKYIISIN